MSTEYGDPGIEWGEADAANDDGEAVMRAEREAGEDAADDPDLSGPVHGVAELRRADAYRHEDPWAPKPDPVLDARIKALVVALSNEIDRAQAGVEAARVLLGDLLDTDFEDADDAIAALVRAHASLGVVERFAAARLKPITDAEKDTELGRLRARTAKLERLLKAYGASCD